MMVSMTRTAHSAQEAWVALALLVLISSPQHQVQSAPFSVPLPTHRQSQQQLSCVNPICPKGADSSSSHPRISYTGGKSYVYNFESVIDTSLEKTTDEKSHTSVKGQAVLTTQSSCDIILTLQNVNVQSPSGQSVTKSPSQLDSSSVRFTYQNGRVEGFCTDENDPKWSANIKRSIVSLLQNTATSAFGDASVVEVDVSGRCPTQYAFSGNTYTKTRNLTNCAYRNGGEWISQGVPYTVASDINSDPMIKSTLSCDQSISDGIVQSVECTERHTLEPLIGSDPDSSTIQTLIKTSLKFESVQDANSESTTKAEKLVIPSSILFDHSDSVPSTAQLSRSGASNTVKIVEQMCTEMNEGTVSANVPGLYLQLGKSMRHTALADLERIYSNIESGQLCPNPQDHVQEKLRKLFVNVAARAGATNTIEFTINRIAEGKVDGPTQALFAYHTSFATKPESSALAAMSKLISTTEALDSSFIFAATALAYEYCRQTNPDCVANTEYYTITTYVAELAGQACKYPSRNENSIQKAIVYIQALGHLNRLPDSAISALSTCIESRDTTARLKIQALEAFRRDPCVEQLKQSALNLFEDKTVSSEVRIHAYLASTRCLVQDDVEALQAILDKEESNQVGSFVLSQIRNQWRTESPISRDLKRVYQQLRISNKFPFDPRRFSTNFGASRFDNSQNLGVSIDSSLIYSQDHFIPRTAQANLTGFFLGRAYNLLEFGLHTENFEHVLERYFGPSASIPKKKPTRQPSSNSIVPAQDTSRPTREISNVGSDSDSESGISPEIINQNDLNALRNVAGPQLKSKFSQMGTMDFYIRELGTSIYSNSFTQKDFTSLKPSSMSLRKLYMAIYEKFVGGSVNVATKNFKVDLTDPTTFIDEEVIFSTISGLPLKLALQGTTVLSMSLDGNLDIPAIIRNGVQDNLNTAVTDIKTKLIPSAATVLRASMNVGSQQFIESGLALEAKVHSSAGIDLDLVRQEGKYEFKFNIPQQKIQIVDMKSELFWTQQVDEELEVKTPVSSKWDGKPSNAVNNQCVNTLSSVLGLKFCIDMKYAGNGNQKAPAFPFAGQSAFAISIEKTEPSMEGYYFKAESFLQSSSDQTITVILDTPGSVTDRKITATGLLQQSDTSTKFGFDVSTPWTKPTRVDYAENADKEMEFNSAPLNQMWNEELLQGVELLAGSGNSKYGGLVQLKQTKLEDKTVLFEPHVSYTMNGATIELLDGQVKTMKSGIQLDLAMAGKTRAFQGKINGLLEYDSQNASGHRFSMTGINLENGAMGKIHLGGSFTLQEALSHLTLKTAYGDALESNFNLDMRSGLTRAGDEYTRTLESKITSTHDPNLNFDMKFTRILAPNTFDINFAFHHGADEGSRSSIVQESKIFWKSSADYKVKNSLEISYPKYDLDFMLSTDSSNALQQMHHDFNIELGENVKTNWKFESKGEDYDFNGLILYPGRSIKLSEVCKKVSPEKWNYKSSYENEPQGKAAFRIDADMDFLWKMDKSEFKNEMHATVFSTAFEAPITFQSELNTRRDYYIASMRLAKPDHDLLNFETEYTEAVGNKPTSFSSKAFIINYFDGQLSEVHDRVSSVFKVDANWLITGRKIIAASNLRRVGQGETYQLDSEILWDAERDPSKSASIKSVSTYQARGGFNLDTKNSITIEKLTRELNLKGKLSNEFFAGETGLEAQFKDSAGQLYAIQLKNANEQKNHGKIQNIVVKVELPDHHPFEVDMTNRLSNMDFERYLGDLVSELSVNFNGNQNMLLQTELHSIRTNRWTISGLVEASGTAIADKMRFDFNTQVQQNRRFAFGVSSSYNGQTSEFLTDVEYDLLSTRKVLDYKYKLRLPYEAIKSIDGAGKYGYLFTSWSNFDMYEQGSVTLNSKAPSTWEVGASFLQNDFKAKYNVAADGRSLFAFGAAGKSTAKRITGVLKNELRGGSKSELIFEVDRIFDQPAILPNPTINLKLNINTTRKEYGLLSYRLNVRSLSAGEIYEASLRGRSASDRFGVASKLEMTKLRKAVEVVLSTDKAATKKVSFALNGPTSDRYNVDALVRWGDDGKTISSSGSLFRTGHTVDGTLVLDSPYYNADKWKVRVSKELAPTGRHAISFTAQSADKDVGTVLIDYSQKQDRQDAATQYNGSLSVKAHTLDFVGAFYTLDQFINEAAESGRQITTTLELSSNQFPVKFEVIGKQTNLEDRYSLAFCNMDETRHNCQTSEVRRQKFNTAAKKGQIISLMTETMLNGRQASADSIAVSSLEQSGAYEQSTMYIASDGQSLGYRAYRNGNTDGLDLELPQRRVAGTITRVSNENMNEISFEGWLDKLRKPTDKLMVVFNSVVTPMQKKSGRNSDTESGTKEMSLLLKHPALEKDLMIKSKTEFQFEDTKSSRSSELTLEIFKPNQELVLMYEITRDFTYESVGIYTFDLGMKSQGQGFQLLFHSDVRKTAAEELSTSSRLSYLNREKQNRIYELDLDYGYNRRVFQLTGPTGRILSYLSDYNYELIPGTNTFDGYEVRREIYLPGMADTRIFQNKVSFSYPPKVDIKMFTISSPPGQYQQFQFGFKNEQEFVASLHEFESKEGGQKSLIDFDIALNNSRLLFVKTEWNKENIKKFLLKGQNRIHNTVSRFQAMTSDSTSYMADEIEHVTKSFKAASLDFNPFMTSVKQELIDMKIETDSSDNVKALGLYYEFMLYAFGTDSHAVKALYSEFSNYTTMAFRAVLDYVTSIPDKVYAVMEMVPSAIRKVQTGFNLTLDTVSQAYSLVITGIIESVERISSSETFATTSAYYASLADTSQGVGKFWNETLFHTLELLSSTWARARTGADDLMKNEWAQEYMRHFQEKYEKVLAKMIQDYKTAVDSIRESVLNSLPANIEIQELLQKLVEYVELRTKGSNLSESGDTELTAAQIQKLQKEIYEKFVNMVKQLSMRIFTVDLQNGVFIAHIPLPAPVKRLTDIDQLFESLPSSNFEKFKIPASAQNYLEYYDPRNHFTLQNLLGSDFFAGLLSGQNSVKELVPPFDGYGMLIGSQFYRTFDGQFYHLDGSCPYLLASDFVDNNFTIVVDYKKERESVIQARKSIVITDSQNTISIEPDSTVLVNGRAASIPSQVGHFTISQSTSWLSVKGARGFEIACASGKDVCLINLNGYYMGKTSGLLGTMNNERFDDLRTVSGDITESSQEMVGTWKLDSQCEEIKHLAPTLIPSTAAATRNSEAAQKCQAAFKLRSSPLSSCFRAVPTSNYEQICASLITDKGYDLNRSVCMAAYSYQLACQRAHVPVEHNSLC